MFGRKSHGPCSSRLLHGVIRIHPARAWACFLGGRGHVRSHHTFVDHKLNHYKNAVYKNRVESNLVDQTSNIKKLGGLKRYMLDQHWSHLDRFQQDFVELFSPSMESLGCRPIVKDMDGYCESQGDAWQMRMNWRRNSEMSSKAVRLGFKIKISRLWLHPT